MHTRLVALVLALASTAVGAEEATLLSAAESGDHPAAIAALKQPGVDVNARGPDGATALLWAVYNRDVELAQQLIAAGADVNAKNEFGAFPLSEAAISGSTPLIRALLEAGANPSEANAEGETALMVVARAGDVEGAELLLKAGADVNAVEAWGQQSPLMWAAAQSQPAMVKLLIAHGADVNARGAVLYAAREGCIDCARELVAGGADLNLPDPHRVTPLVLALLNLHFDFAAYLIEAGADVNKWDLYGRTPLYMAADTSTLPVMGNGSMVVLPSMDKLTALDIAKQLLAKGADPNIQLKRRPPYRNVPQDRGGDTILSFGATPLLRAARAGDAPMVELLLQHGALVDLPSNQGVTPLMAAAGLEYGLRVTRGRNRTEEGVLKTLQITGEHFRQIYASSRSRVARMRRASSSSTNG